MLPSVYLACPATVMDCIGARWLTEVGLDAGLLTHTMSLTTAFLVVLTGAWPSGAA